MLIRCSVWQCLNTPTACPAEEMTPQTKKRKKNRKSYILDE